MKNYGQIIFVFLVTALCLRLFDATFLDKKIVNYLVFVGLMGSGLYSVLFLFPKTEGFVWPIQLISLSIFISIFMANISWDQGFKDSIIETMPYLTWTFFFYLIHVKVPIRTIENLILVFGALYIVLYFYQLSQTPTVLFGKALVGDEWQSQRGFTRIVFPGAGIFILAVFISINKLTTQAKMKWMWLSFSICGLLLPFLQVTRQFIAGITLIYLFHFLRGQRLHKKLLVIGFCMAAFAFISNSDSQIVKGLSEAVEDDYNEGEKYVRVLAGKYFLTDFSPNTASRILGNGAPLWGESSYGIFVESMEHVNGFFISDVGIIGMYAMFGVLAVIGYILIWIKTFTLSVPKEFYYVKYYLWYLLLTSLTWFTVYHYHYLIATVLALYIYQRVYIRNSVAPE